jgi:hypothetical protein
MVDGQPKNYTTMDAKCICYRGAPITSIGNQNTRFTFIAFTPRAANYAIEESKIRNNIIF